MKKIVASLIIILTFVLSIGIANADQGVDHISTIVGAVDDTFYLTNDVSEGASTVSISGNVTLDLKGHSVNISSGSVNLFEIESGGTLTLIDSVGSGYISFSGYSNHVPFYVESGGTLNISSGIYRTVDTVSTVINYGTVTINGGTIENNSSINSTITSSGTLNIYGGNINNSDATTVAVIDYTGGTLNLKGSFSYSGKKTFNLNGNALALGGAISNSVKYTFHSPGADNVIVSNWGTYMSSKDPETYFDTLDNTISLESVSGKATLITREILTEPTLSSPTVVLSTEKGVNFEWYKLSKNDAYVTGTSAANISKGSYDISSKVWRSDSNGGLNIDIEASEGDTLIFTFNKDFSVGDFTYLDPSCGAIGTFVGKTYTYTVDSMDVDPYGQCNIALELDSSITSREYTVKIYKESYSGTKITGETSKTLSTVEAGNIYYATCNYDSGLVLKSKRFSTASLHSHSFTYKGSSNTLTAECSESGCSLTSGKISVLLIANDITYDGNNYDKVSITNKSNFESETGLTLTPIYEGTGTTTYVSSSTSPVNSGEYKVSIKCGSAIASTTFKINKGTYTYTTEPEAVNNILYDGNSHELIVNGTSESTIYYRISKIDGKDVTGEFSTNIPSAKDQGEYTISYYIKGDSNHSDSTIKTLSVKISKSSEPDSIMVDVKDKAYDGNPYDGITVTNLSDFIGLSESDISISYEGTNSTTYNDTIGPTGVGTYKAVINLGSKSETVNFKITKGSLKYESYPKGISNIVYDGKYHDLITKGSGTYDIYYTISKIDGVSTGYSYSLDIPSAKDVGEYTISYYIKGDELYNDTAEEEIIVTIANSEEEKKEAINPEIKEEEEEVIVPSSDDTKEEIIDEKEDSKDIEDKDEDNTNNLLLYLVIFLGLLVIILIIILLKRRKDDEEEDEKDVEDK